MKFAFVRAEPIELDNRLLSNSIEMQHESGAAHRFVARNTTVQRVTGSCKMNFSLVRVFCPSPCIFYSQHGRPYLAMSFASRLIFIFFFFVWKKKNKNIFASASNGPKIVLKKYNATPEGCDGRQ